VTAGLISVIVPVFNSQDYIESCLVSIISQQCENSIEIIVVDDGSTDHSVQICSKYPEIKLIQQHNQGPAAARNRGIAAANGAFVAFLDSDDIWPSGKLAQQMAVFKRYPEVGLVFGDCRQFSLEEQETTTYFEKARLDRDFWGSDCLVKQPYDKLLHINFITTGSVLARRQFLEQAGLFDESLRLVEDFDLWLRMALICPFARNAEVALLRRRHSDNISRDELAMSTAALTVLTSHRQQFATQLKIAGVSMNPRIAREYVSLGYLQLTKNQWSNACRSYVQALLEQPSTRHCYYLIKVLLFGWLYQFRS
jgi:glycosyltransferase involved in cell wall biosynthesis